MTTTTYTTKSFTALLEPDGSKLNWVVARIPFDAAKVWPERNGRRVRGDIEGFPFRTSLFPDPRGKGQVLLVNKRMQSAANARAGSKVRIRIEPDFEERPAVMPSELAAIFKTNRALYKWFNTMSPSMRREIGKWVDDAKSTQVRMKRAEKIAERMMLTMEGEKEPPPILRRLFQCDSRMQIGWNLLSANQRRNHLLSIFYYETIEARERRAQKVAEEALRVATRNSKQHV